MAIERIGIGTCHYVTKESSKFDLNLARDILEDRKKIIIQCSEWILDAQPETEDQSRLLYINVAAEGETCVDRAIDKINKEIEAIDAWLSTKTLKYWFLNLLGW